MQAVALICGANASFVDPDYAQVEQRHGFETTIEWARCLTCRGVVVDYIRWLISANEINTRLLKSRASHLRPLVGAIDRTSPIFVVMEASGKEGAEPPLLLS